MKSLEQINRDNALAEWSLLPKPTSCDLCRKRAMWWHPAGGYRCGTCPRPTEKQ